MDLIITTPERLTQIVAVAVNKAFEGVTKEPLAIEPDRLDLTGAIDHTGLSKSTIYKMTMEGKIPFSKFGNKLVFSRKELSQWMGNQTVQRMTVKDFVSENLSKQAKKGRVS